VVDVVRARRMAAIALLALASGCSREPSEQEVAARKARERAIVEASQEEERSKDRARMAAASAEAAAETEAIRAPATSLSSGEPARPPTITMLDKVHPVQTTEEQVIAQATARVEMTLANPPSMLVRSPQLREQNTVVCLEVNSRDAASAFAARRLDRVESSSRSRSAAAAAPVSSGGTRQAVSSCVSTSWRSGSAGPRMGRPAARYEKTFIGNTVRR